MTELPSLGRFDAFHHSRRLRRARRTLRKDEAPLALVAGRDLKRSGLLLLTTQRVLWLAGWRKKVFPLADLQGIRTGISGDQAVLTLESPGLQLVVARVPSQAGADFEKAVRQAAAEVGNHALRSKTVDDRPPEEALPAGTAKQRLERLERMLEQGSITYPEYLANRRRIQEQVEPLPDPPKKNWYRRF